MDRREPKEKTGGGHKKHKKRKKAEVFAADLR